MNIRPKTIRRLVALLLVCVLLAAAGVVVWFYHQQNKTRQLKADREFGIAAFHAGDYPLALERLRPYKEKFPDDYDAVYAYATSRLRTPSPAGSPGRNIAEAKQLFEQLNRARPDDANVAHVLLELYTSFNLFPEAARLADTVLARDPRDTAALYAKALALQGSGKPDDALATVDRLDAIDPANFRAQRLTIGLLHRLQRPAGEVLKRYADLQQKHPDDPRYEVLMALACEYGGDEPGTLKWLRSAATRPMPDADFVRTLARFLDGCKLYDESQALLEREAERSKDPAVVQVLVMRLWQDGRYDEVVKRLAGYDVAADAKAAPSDLLAMKALALYQLNDADAARTIVAGLKARKSDNPAQAWSSALSTRYDGTATDQRAALKRYESAVLRDVDNGIIHHWMGETYLRMNEPQLAIRQWRVASSLMPGWVAPRVAVARTLLASGRPQAAAEAAVDAVRVAPQAVYPRVVLAKAKYAMLGPSAPADEVQQLLRFAQDIHRVVRSAGGEPETLPILVDLQARTGDKAGAAQTMRAALAASAHLNPSTTTAPAAAASSQPTSQPSALPPETLVQLLGISRRYELELDEPIVACLPPALVDPARATPADVAALPPSLALQWAGELARKGNPHDGLEYLTRLESAAAAARPPLPANVRLGWSIAIAQYRDAISDAGARDAWVKIGDEHPDDVNVQATIATTAQSAATDREFFGRTLDRLEKLSPPDGQLWRLAKARWLLAGTGSGADAGDEETTAEQLTNAGAAGATTTTDEARRRREIGDAIVLLTELVRNGDHVPEYRVLLAHGLLKLGNIKDATEHLRIAVDLDPTSVPTCLQFAALLQAQGKDTDARQYLDRAARSPHITTRSRKILASLLVRQGDAQAALDALKPAADRLKGDEPARLLYAELLRKRGNAADAAAVYDELMQDPAPGAEAIVGAADFYATQGRAADAERTIARLNDPRFPLARRTGLLARYSEAHGNPDAAAKQYLAAVEADRAQAPAWIDLINFYVRRNQVDDAEQAANRAMAAVAQTDPARRDVAAVQQQIAVRRAESDPSADLKPLIDTLSKDAANAPQVEMLRAMQQARDAVRSVASASNAGARPPATLDPHQLAEQYAMRLRAAAEQYPQYLPLQSTLCEQYMALGRADEAARVAERAMEQRPGDPEAARLAYNTYQSTGRWREARRAAGKWRDRTLDAPAAADLALAEAMVNLDDGKGALSQLAPYLDAARAQPDQNPTVIELAARAMIAQAKPADARALLEPLTARSPMWRTVFLKLAAAHVTPADEARSWIDAAAHHASPDAQREQVQVAQSWLELGQRLNDAEAKTRGRQLLQTLADRPDADPAALFLLASLESEAKDYAAAEQHYRRVLKDHPDQPDAQNNLAYLLLIRDDAKDLAEAKALASKAVERSPATAAFHDTLARVAARLGLRDQALASFKAALALEPANLEALVGLADAISSGPQPDRDKATELLQRIDSLLNKSAKQSMSEPLQQELNGVRQRISQVQ